MNFVTTDIKTVLKDSKSRSTHSKTLQDVAYFHLFLAEVKGINDRKIEDLPEPELVELMSEFLAGIKKKKDGGEYEPTSLWALYASL